MATTVTVAGAPITPLQGTLDIEASYGSRHLCRLTVEDAGGTLSFAHDEEVVVLDGATRIFGGLVDEVGREGLWPESLVAVRHLVTAVDFRARCDQRVVTETYAAGMTLAEVLIDLRTTYLDAFGITMDGAQASPAAALPEITWDHVTLRDALDQLSGWTGWLWNVSYTKVFGMYTPATVAAPFAITTTSRTCRKLTTTQARTDYRNRQFLIIGTPGIFPHSYDQVGNGVKTRFALPFVGIGFGIPGWCSVKRGAGAFVDFPVGWYPGDPQEWLYDGATNELVQSYGTVLAAIDTLRMMQSVQYPQTIVVEDGTAAANPWEKITQAPDIYGYSAAIVAATALLRKYGNADLPKQVALQTDTAGLVPGQALSVGLPGFALSSSEACLVTSVRMNHMLGTTGRLRYQVEAIEGTELPELFQDTWRSFGAGGASISGAILMSSDVGSVSISPFHAHIGGSRTQDVASTGWVPIPENQTFRAPSDSTYSVRLERLTLSTGVTVQARLWDITTTGAVVTGAATASTAWEEETLAAALTAGHRYRVELVGSSSETGVRVGQATVEL